MLVWVFFLVTLRNRSIKSSQRFEPNRVKPRSLSVSAGPTTRPPSALFLYYFREWAAAVVTFPSHNRRPPLWHGVFLTGCLMVWLGPLFFSFSLYFFVVNVLGTRKQNSPAACFFNVLHPPLLQQAFVSKSEDCRDYLHCHFFWWRVSSVSFFFEEKRSLSDQATDSMFFFII